PRRSGPAPSGECAGRARARSRGEPDANTDTLAGRTCRGAQEQRFARPDRRDRVTTGPTCTVLPHPRVTAANARRGGERTDDGPGTGTGGGGRRLESGGGSGCAGDDGSYPRGRAPGGDVPRGSGARARRAHRRAAALRETPRCKGSRRASCNVASWRRVSLTGLP